ncbi:MAG: hypothetical protein JWR69_2939 [Pedosphaera sp.]|nr:hypothetical protein [Pedosphaera sp.]
MAATDGTEQSKLIKANPGKSKLIQVNSGCRRVEDRGGSGDTRKARADGVGKVVGVEKLLFYIHAGPPDLRSGGVGAGRNDSGGPRDPG